MFSMSLTLITEFLIDWSPLKGNISFQIQQMSLKIFFFHYIHILCYISWLPEVTRQISNYFKDQNKKLNAFLKRKLNSNFENYFEFQFSHFYSILKSALAFDLYLKQIFTTQSSILLETILISSCFISVFCVVLTMVSSRAGIWLFLFSPHQDTGMLRRQRIGAYWQTLLTAETAAVV